MMVMYFFEIVTRLMPEVFTTSFIVYTLSNVYINKGRYIAMNLFLCFSVYIIKGLPIFPVINIMMIIIMFISVFVIMRIPLIKSVKNTLSAFMILQLCELLNIICCLCFNIKITEYTSIYMKDIYGIPSLVLFMAIAFFLRNRERIKKGNLKDSDVSGHICT